MSKEMLPELNTSGDFIFKIGIGSVIVIIIYFIFNLFSKLREINEKLDSFLTDFKPAEAQEYQNDTIEDITEQSDKKESNVDLTGIDKDLEPIEE
jgi:Sec-independent protein translocase protein TatA